MCHVAEKRTSASTGVSAHRVPAVRASHLGRDVRPGTMASRLLLLLLLGVVGVHNASGGRVKQALFGSFFGDMSKKELKDHLHAAAGISADAELADLIEFLRSNGFGKYAGKDFIDKLDEDLAYDSIEDMTHLVSDDDYIELGMPHDEAMQIQKLARREMLKRFLASVPLPSGETSGLFAKHLDALIIAGYDEPDDVADLEEDEAERMGISLEHARILVTYAEEYETRLLLHVILTTHTDPNGGMPYSSEVAWRPLINALVKAGVRSLADVGQLSQGVPGVSHDDLVALQNDPRVLQHTHKQEL